jgi:hypothetical protein
MPFYRTCPDCGAHLDPDETCDCRDQIRKPQKINKKLKNNIQKEVSHVRTQNQSRGA